MFCPLSGAQAISGVRDIMINLRVCLDLLEADCQQGCVVGPEGDKRAGCNGAVLGDLLVLEHLVLV